MAEKAEFKIDLQWKEFNVSLDVVHTWLKANAGPLYCGTQAHRNFEVWFVKPPEDSVIISVQAYWNGLAPDGTEAKEYVPSARIQERVEELKAGLLAKNWDQMSLAERKLMLGQTPTHVELGLI